MTEAEIRALLDPADLRLPGCKEIGIEEFLLSIAKVRRDGWCITSGLVDAFTHCIAAPVRDLAGNPAATLCFVVPMETLDARITELRDVLIETCQALSPGSTSPWSASSPPCR